MKKYITLKSIALIMLVFSKFSYALGNVEGISLNNKVLSVQGWACDNADRDAAVGIHVYKENTYLGGSAAYMPREWPVAVACNSSNSNHGFYFTINIPENLLDNQNHYVDIYAVGSSGSVEKISGASNYINFEGPFKNPTKVGDIVGRDLVNAPIFGHIGIWDGSQVVEVLNEPGNVIKTNSIENFKSRATPWKTLSPNIPSYPVKTCYDNYCTAEGAVFGGTSNNYSYTTFDSRVALIRRAFQIKTIGASYTYASLPALALPNISSSTGNSITPQRSGLYRCDTFILDLFAWIDIRTGDGTITNKVALTQSTNYIPYNREIQNEPSSWKNKTKNLMTGATTPVDIYNRFKLTE